MQHSKESYVQKLSSFPFFRAVCVRSFLLIEDRSHLCFASCTVLQIGQLNFGQIHEEHDLSSIS